MNRINYIEPGTILKVYCPNKYVWHYGIMSWDGHVIDRGKRGIRRRSWSEFSDDLEVQIVPPKPNDFPKDIIHSRALANVGKRGYDIIFKNCEHFVSWCRKGQFTSKQLNTVLVVIASVIVFIWIIRASNKKLSK